MSSQSLASPFGKVLGLQHHMRSANLVVASFTVNASLLQPMGILHGGVSAAVIEELASFGTSLSLDANSFLVGTNVTADHLAMGKRGHVIYAIGSPVHQGRKIHLWHVTLVQAPADQSSDHEEKGRDTILSREDQQRVNAAFATFQNPVFIARRVHQLLHNQKEPSPGKFTVVCRGKMTAMVLPVRKSKL